jgi:hypothetical protein
MPPRFITATVLGTLGTLAASGCEEPPAPYAYAVEAADQEATAGGTSVVIAKVSTDRPIWVAIHAEDDGDFSARLGKTAVATAGDNVKVALDVAAQDGQKLHALLYLDAGEPGVWEDKLDLKLKTSKGLFVYASFTVQVLTTPPALAVEATDQTVDPPDRVVIAKVQAANQGWVAVYEDAGGVRGDVLGKTAVGVGGNPDVEVELSRNLEDGETVQAVLHDDQGTPGTWDYPGADVPVKDANGNQVQASFTVSLPPPGPTPSVTAKDQVVPVPKTGANPTVSVEKVVSVGPGWVAVHEDDGDAGYGGVVGVAAVKDGETKALQVEVERPIQDGEMLHAILHADLGTPDVFEFPGADLAVKLGDGKVVAASFKAEVPVTPAVTVANQTLSDPSQVTIALVASDGPGWIVIHEASGESFGEVILGQTAVPDGSSGPITVVLSRPALDGETLYAMLHINAGDTEVLEFPDGPDVPVPLPVEGGDPLMALPFQVTVPVVPALAVSDQTNPKPANTVSLGSVSSEGPGWVVIRDGDDGSELGHVAVAHGTSTKVKVELERDMVGGETLYAILHVDKGGAGTYEFPGADVPAKGPGGSEVQASFEVSIP